MYRDKRSPDETIPSVDRVIRSLTLWSDHVPPPFQTVPELGDCRSSRSSTANPFSASVIALRSSGLPKWLGSKPAVSRISLDVHLEYAAPACPGRVQALQLYIDVPNWVSNVRRFRHTLPPCTILLLHKRNRPAIAAGRATYILADNVDRKFGQEGNARWAEVVGKVTGLWASNDEVGSPA